MPADHLTDLDGLILTVRDLYSREYIGEAVSGYRAGAYRSSLIATWIAVTYDIISKIRELESQGDAEARVFIADLDVYIAMQQTMHDVAVKKLQIIENDLLNKSLHPFEFLSPQEFTDLDRLKQDRNLCAHPAFAGDNLLFQPTPELVRAHIVHAITHLLQHPPVQGKAALDRIRNDILQPSFPSTQNEVSEFLEGRYLNRAKKSLLNGLLSIWLKAILRNTDAELAANGSRVLQCLVAVNRRHPTVYEQRVSTELARLTDGCQVIGDFMRIFPLFRADKRCWDWLNQPIRLKIIQIVRDYAYSASDVEHIMSGLEIDQLRPYVVAKVKSLPSNSKQIILSQFHRPEFIEEAISLFAEAGSFRGAEAIAQYAVLPLSDTFRTEHVEQILSAAENNGQIYAARGTDAFLAEVLDRTADLHANTKAAWQHFMQRMTMIYTPTDPFFNYRTLRDKMVAASMWPV